MWKAGAFKAVAPPVSVKDRWVGPREQILNVPITCRCYGSGKPSSWLSIEACLFPTTSLVVMGEKLGTNPWIRHPLSCGLCRDPFFSGVVICTNLLMTSRKVAMH
jgi:hypothetical protein